MTSSRRGGTSRGYQKSCITGTMSNSPSPTAPKWSTTSSPWERSVSWRP
ncbi:hypothetical protein LEMLEM_LOCUS12421 [Lemmus lemmus]